MDVEKWKGLARRAFPKDRAVKLLVLLGICGIALIYLSTLLGDGREKQESPAEEASSGVRADGEELEKDLARIVRAVTGEQEPTVLVTLESGSRYVYAADAKENSRESGEESSGESETAHVILKDSDGAQHALTVTEIQPEVKGVVIVSRFAGDPAVREKLTNAVRTALDISSAKVCVTDTG